MSAKQRADILDWLEFDPADKPNIEAAAMLRTQHEDIKVLREALSGMVNCFTDSDSGEMDRKLTVKDARAALAATEEFK